MLVQAFVCFMFVLLWDDLRSRVYTGADGMVGFTRRVLLKVKPDTQDHKSHTDHLVETYDPDYLIKVQNLRKAYITAK